MTDRKADHQRAEVSAVRIANLGQHDLAQSGRLVSARQGDVADSLFVILAQHFAHGGQRLVQRWLVGQPGRMIFGRQDRAVGIEETKKRRASRPRADSPVEAPGCSRIPSSSVSAF